jgi:hypothetical protein
LTSVEPKVSEPPLDWKKKTEYGKVPRYLKDIKDQMNREYEHIRSLHEQEQEARQRDK